MGSDAADESRPEASVSLVVTSDGLSAEEISRLLGVRPTSTAVGSGSARGAVVWTYGGTWSGDAPRERLRSILALIESDRSAFHTLNAQSRTVLSIGVSADADADAPVNLALTPDELALLGALGIELWMSVYLLPGSAPAAVPDSR
jgi:Domain of unknown function (DUF4279)